ncbi:MAG: hypothetical protein LUC91_10485 [Prevotella sp.]|nr:hypothetical protein [Prevotella sp.]
MITVRMTPQRMHTPFVRDMGRVRLRAVTLHLLRTIRMATLPLHLTAFLRLRELNGNTCIHAPTPSTMVSDTCIGTTASTKIVSRAYMARYRHDRFLHHPTVLRRQAGRVSVSEWQPLPIDGLHRDSF